MEVGVGRLGGSQRDDGGDEGLGSRGREEVAGGH